MGFYEDQVLPRVINVVCGMKELREPRSRTCEGLEGDVVEIGFGSGLNVPYYPSGVKRVLAVDPSLVGRKLAAKRLAGSPVAVEFVGLDGENLPLEDASADAVLSTFTLCTIPGVEGALAEINRVLVPGGDFHFLEHGLSPDPKVAKRQDRLNSLQNKIAGGCHLNRRILDLIAAAGFEIDRVDNYYLSGGPKSHGYMYEGVATKA